MVILERGSPGDRDGVVSVEEVFFSKAFGFCPEFFEKSIDKHKIDAILNSTVRRSGREVAMGLAVVSASSDVGTTEPIHSRQRSGVVYPYGVVQWRVVVF